MMVCINPKKKFKQQKNLFGGQLEHKDEKGAENVDKNAAEKFKTKNLT